jgi:hypothetical protein
LMVAAWMASTGFMPSTILPNCLALSPRG